MNNVKLEADKIKANTERPEAVTAEDKEFIEMMPWDQQGCLERMEEINKAVKDVSVGGEIDRGDGRSRREQPVTSKKTLSFRLSVASLR